MIPTLDIHTNFSISNDINTISIFAVDPDTKFFHPFKKKTYFIQIFFVLREQIRAIQQQIFCSNNLNYRADMLKHKEI